jgi:hypothetical protein
MVPEWGDNGILPPVFPGASGNSTERSPYCTDLVGFIDGFSLSPERTRLLEGFLGFRAELKKINIVSGFHWIDGSFIENIDIIENRPPHDIDIVTFFHLPDGESQRSLYEKAPLLFNHDYVKETYAVDHYFRPFLGKELESPVVKEISYWYSMWSHRRDSLWKGFVQISLDQADDENAKMVLNSGREGKV